jgi:hypothetical protein
MGCSASLLELDTILGVRAELVQAAEDRKLDDRVANQGGNVHEDGFGNVWELFPTDAQCLHLSKHPPARTVKLSGKGCKVKVQAGVKCTEFGLKRQIKIGLIDKRSGGIQIGTEVAVVLSNKGFLGESKSRLKKTLAAGEGQCAFSYFLPCLNASMSGIGKFFPLAFAYSSGSILGATVTGIVKSESFEEDGEDIEFDFDLEADPASGCCPRGRARIQANKNDPGMAFFADCTQDGGPVIYPAKFQGWKFTKFLKYLDVTWRQQVQRSPSTWTVQKITVMDPDEVFFRASTTISVSN